MAKTKARKMASRSKGKSGSRPRLRDSKLFEIPNYAQTYEFTSSAASIMMVLKYLTRTTR